MAGLCVQPLLFLPFPMYWRGRYLISFPTKQSQPSSRGIAHCLLFAPHQFPTLGLNYAFESSSLGFRFWLDRYCDFCSRVSFFFGLARQCQIHTFFRYFFCLLSSFLNRQCSSLPSFFFLLPFVVLRVDLSSFRFPFFLGKMDLSHARELLRNHFPTPSSPKTLQALSRSDSFPPTNGFFSIVAVFSLEVFLPANLEQCSRPLCLLFRFLIFPDSVIVPSPFTLDTREKTGVIHLPSLECRL